MPKARKLSQRETAAVLAGLRLVQQRLAPIANGEDVDDILTNGDAFAPLSVAYLSRLCEAINTREVTIAW